MVPCNAILYNLSLFARPDIPYSSRAPALLVLLGSANPVTQCVCPKGAHILSLACSLTFCFQTDRQRDRQRDYGLGASSGGRNRLSGVGISGGIWTLLQAWPWPSGMPNGFKEQSRANLICPSPPVDHVEDSTCPMPIQKIW
jgi:hypothetical protein